MPFRHAASRCRSGTRSYSCRLPAPGKDALAVPPPALHDADAGAENEVVTRLAHRLHALDERVLGRPVPDTRPLRERMLRPRPAVWSTRGRVLFGLIIVGTLGLGWWGPDSAWAGLAVAGLLAAAFLVIAADERKRARRHFGEDERGSMSD